MTARGHIAPSIAYRNRSTSVRRVRVSGRNAVDYLVNITSEGLSYAQEDVSGMPAVIEFDPGSLVLTAFGRMNAGTIRGDRAVADKFLNSFFRI